MSVRRFRKRPLEIEAVPVADALHAAARAWGDLPTWLALAYERGDVVFARDFVSIRTLEGLMQASKGDWIICGVQGELYSCRGDIFEQTYEPADEPEVAV